MANKKSPSQGRASKGFDSADTSGSSTMTPSSSSSADREGGFGEVEKPRRGRVSMACLYCRQRKIKCDAQHPTCKNCARLNRECEYESVTETENMLSRERKRLGKQAKQERLATLAQLGIISPQSSEAAASSGNARRATSSSKRANRNEAAAPYVRFTSDIGAKKPGSARSRSDTVAAGQRPHPGLLDLADVAPSVLRRTRGVTVSGYGSGERSVMDTMLLEAQERATGVNITSLSQPTTPEGTYAVHASMLQSDLTGGAGAVHPYYQQSPWAAYGASLQSRSLPWHEQAQSSSSAMSSAQHTPTTWPTELAAESNYWPTTRRDQGGLQLTNMNPYARRRSSLNILPQWTHRPSNADVAVASFFNRVMSAQPSSGHSGQQQQQCNDVIASGLPTPPTIIQPYASGYQQTSPSDDSRGDSLGRSSSRPISFHDSWGGRSTSSSTHNSSGFGTSVLDGSNHSSPGQYGVGFRHGSGSTGSASASGAPHSPVTASAPYPASLSSAAMAATSSGSHQGRLSLGTMPPQMMYLPVAGHTESPAATSPRSPNTAAFFAAQHAASGQPMYAGAPQQQPMTQSAAEVSATWAQMRNDAHLGQLSPDSELSRGMRGLGASPILAGSVAPGGVAYVSPQALDHRFNPTATAAADVDMSGSSDWASVSQGMQPPAPWSGNDEAATPTWWTSNEADEANSQRGPPPS